MQSSAITRRTFEACSGTGADVQDHVDHWLFDSERLNKWQGELVNCCNAINDQLSQIRTGLNALPLVTTPDSCVVSLRIVADYDRG